MLTLYTYFRSSAAFRVRIALNLKGLDWSPEVIWLPGGEQTFIGSNWGDVTPFAIGDDADGLPIDPRPPPLLADPATADAYRDSAVEVIRASTSSRSTSPAMSNRTSASRCASSGP